MQLILCEKPSAAKNYATALGGYTGVFNGKAYKIVNSVGHIFSMPGPDEQVSSENVSKYKSWNLSNLPWKREDLAFKKVLNKGMEEVFGKIKKAAKDCDEFVIATDDDPTGEGTLLANEIIEALHLTGVEYFRSFHIDESPKEIQKAMRNLKPLGRVPKTDPDYIKSDFRSKWDYMSMQWTRVFTQLGDGSVLRQGRLKSYMVWAVGEQIRKNEEYQKIPYYQNRFVDENGNVYTDEDEPMYPKKEEVDSSSLHASDIVHNPEEKKKSPPPGLYDLNMLSASLASSGYSSKLVLDTYQKMYDDNVVSYPRTEDKTITTEQFNDFLGIADAVAEVVDVDKKLLTHRAPRKTHVVDAGSHGANRPASNVPFSLDEVKKKYGPCGSLIYQFVARNALAMLCEDYEYIHQSGYVKDFPSFKGSVNIPLKAGYKQIFDDDKKEVTKELGKKGEPFIYEGFPPKPAWPTAKWLAKLLRKNDVGTGATRTSIYSDVTDSKAKYPLLTDTKGKINMTEYGKKSYLLLKDTHIGDVKLTEKLQEQIKEVAKGKNPDEYLDELAKLIVEDIETVKKNAQINKIGVENGGEASLVCPKCGKPLRKFAWGYSCSGYKKDEEDSCSFAIPFNFGNGILTDEDIKDLLNEKQTKKKISFKSKAGTPFKAFLKLDGEKISFDFGEKELGICCPKCGGKLVISDFGVRCANKEQNCDFKVNRKIAKKNLTDSQLFDLINDKKTGVISGFKKKDGGSFSAKLALNEYNTVVFTR